LKQYICLIELGLRSAREKNASNIFLIRVFSPFQYYIHFLSSFIFLIFYSMRYTNRFHHTSRFAGGRSRVIKSVPKAQLLAAIAQSKQAAHNQPVVSKTAATVTLRLLLSIPCCLKISGQRDSQLSHLFRLKSFPRYLVIAMLSGFQHRYR